MVELEEGSRDNRRKEDREDRGGQGGSRGCRSSQGDSRDYRNQGSSKRRGEEGRLEEQLWLRASETHQLMLRGTMTSIFPMMTDPQEKSLVSQTLCKEVIVLWLLMEKW